MRNLAWIAASLALACGGAFPQSNEQDLKGSAPASTVVLVHGMGGFQKIEGIDYFWHVPALYRSLGARVFVPGTTTFASTEKRAQELKDQLDAVPGPLILIGHSQGGMDARFLVSRLGYADRVRAVVTIATPHHGSPLADVALGLAPGPVQDAVDALIGTLGWSLDGAREVTVDYMEHVFNPTVPDAPGVTYWSFSGRAAPFAIGSQNGWLHSPLLASWTFLDAEAGASDGIVPEKSAHWGTFLGSLPADHLGEVDQPLGYTPDFDAQSFYAALLHRLRDQGF
jgi:alpha/beta hydrolase family protein